MAPIKVAVFRTYVTHIKLGALLNTYFASLISKIYEKLSNHSGFQTVESLLSISHEDPQNSAHGYDLPLRSDFKSIICAGPSALMLYKLAHFYHIRL